MPDKSSTPPETRPSRARRLLFVASLGLIVGLIGAGLLGWGPLSNMSRGDKPASQTISDPDAPLASFYAPSVTYWKPQIERWGKEYQLNPNVIAIIMQIESCGDPIAQSGAGALGLMQVMPFNFVDGENMINPDTNVKRGMAHLQSCLDFADWDMGRALACYNAGFVDPSDWVPETQAYYRWGTGLWQDVTAGNATSTTLDEWLAAGGSILCTRADQVLPALQAAQTSPAS